MKYTYVFTLFLVFVFCISCGGQNKPGISNNNSKTEDIVTSTRTNNPGIHTQYEYSDSAGKRLVIQNGYPRGGTKYTDPDGEEYAYAIFWTRIINETHNPLQLKIDFLDTYEVPSLPGRYFKLLVLPDTMTTDKEELFNYGLTNLNAFLDTTIHKPSSLRRTINPKESSSFYVVKINPRAEGAGGGDILRTGLILKGQKLFYKVSRYSSTPDHKPPSLIIEKEIECGSINLRSLVLQK